MKPYVYVTKGTNCDGTFRYGAILVNPYDWLDTETLDIDADSPEEAESAANQVIINRSDAQWAKR